MVLSLVICTIFLFLATLLHLILYIRNRILLVYYGIDVFSFACASNTILATIWVYHQLTNLTLAFVLRLRTTFIVNALLQYVFQTNDLGPSLKINLWLWPMIG